MSTDKVSVTSNNPGEVTLKGFHYMKDKFPDDFETCLIVERDGHLSAGCWDTGLWSTENGKQGSFRQSRGGVIEPEDVLAWLSIEKATINIEGLWWNPEYRLIAAFLDCVMVFARDADDCLMIEYSGGDREKILFRMDVKTGNIIEINKKDRDEIYYLQSTLRAWYEDWKEKLLEDYYSGRYHVLPKWE